MPVTIKAGQMGYKSPSSGEYVGINGVAERTTAEQIADVEAAGTAVIADIQTKADEVTAQLANAAEVRNMIAGVFDPNTAYTAGQYVIQTVTVSGSSVNKLFRFITDHAAGGWTGTDAVEVKLGNDVETLKSATNSYIANKTEYTSSGEGRKFIDAVKIVKGKHYTLINNSISVINAYTTNEEVYGGTVPTIDTIGTGISSGNKVDFVPTEDAKYFYIYAGGTGTLTIIDTDTFDYTEEQIDELQGYFNGFAESVNAENNFFSFKIEAGKKYIIANLSADNINAYTANSISTTNVETIATDIYRGNYAIFTATQNASFIRVYSASSGNIVFSEENGVYEILAYDKIYIDNGFQRLIQVGANKKYKTLRSGVEEAVKTKNSVVLVDPGTYNLNNEFAEEIQAAEGNAGIQIYNGVHIIFYKGAKVTATFESNNDWAYNYFQPFYAVNAENNDKTNNDFILENVNIEATNCRYCVHDEMASKGKGLHKFINCVMKYTCTRINPAYVQCIGGGLGKNIIVVIDGGVYESAPSNRRPFINSVKYSQTCISYHNGSGSGLLSQIFIKNVYLKNYGYFMFGYYGPSTEKTVVSISGCRVGLPTLHKAEAQSSTVDNFDVLEWQNDIALPGEWVIDGINASYEEAN